MDRFGAKCQSFQNCSRRYNPVGTSLVTCSYYHFVSDESKPFAMLTPVGDRIIRGSSQET